VDALRCGVVDLDGRRPADELAQRHSGLQPGEVGAEAEVPAATEADRVGQLVAAAVEVVDVRAVEDLLVPVRGAQQQHQLRPGGSGAPVQRHVALEVAGQDLGRGVVAQRLLDPPSPRRGRGRRARCRAARGYQVAQYSALPSSFVVVSLPATTIRNRKPMISSSVSRSPSISASSSAEVRSSVRRRRRSASISAVVLDQLERGVDALRGDVADALLAVDHEVGEAPDLVAVGLGDAHQLGDDVHRQLAGEGCSIQSNSPAPAPARGDDG
jgi:hypothetical protein